MLRTMVSRQNRGDVLLEARRRQVEDVRRSFGKDELWIWAKSNNTKKKNVFNDLDTVLAMIVENGWSKEMDDMNRIWISVQPEESNPR